MKEKDEKEENKILILPRINVEEEMLKIAIERGFYHTQNFREIGLEKIKIDNEKIKIDNDKWCKQNEIEMNKLITEFEIKIKNNLIENQKRGAMNGKEGEIKTERLINEVKNSEPWSFNLKLDNFAKNQMAYKVNPPLFYQPDDSEEIEKNIFIFNKINYELEKKEEERNPELLCALKQHFYKSSIDANKVFIADQQKGLFNSNFIPLSDKYPPSFILGYIIKPSVTTALSTQWYDLMELSKLILDCMPDTDPFKLVYYNKLITTINWNTIIHAQLDPTHSSFYLPFMEKIETKAEYLSKVPDLLNIPDIDLPFVHEIVWKNNSEIEEIFNIRENNSNDNPLDITPITFEPPLLENDPLEFGPFVWKNNSNDNPVDITPITFEPPLLGNDNFITDSHNN